MKKCITALLICMAVSVMAIPSYIPLWDGMGSNQQTTNWLHRINLMASDLATAPSDIIPDAGLTPAKINNTGAGAFALQTITITGVDGCTGGGALSGNRTIGIAAGGVILARMADNSVNSAKIVDASITAADLAPNSVNSAELVADSVTTAKIAAGAVTYAEIGADAVNGTRIADDSIDSEHYVDGSIDSVHLANGIITSNKIATGAVTSVHIENGSILGADIKDATITASDLASSSVANDEIASGAVTSNKLAAALWTAINSAVTSSGGNYNYTLSTSYSSTYDTSPNAFLIQVQQNGVNASDWFCIKVWISDSTDVPMISSTPMDAILTSSSKGIIISKTVGKDQYEMCSNNSGALWLMIDAAAARTFYVCCEIGGHLYVNGPIVVTP